MGDQLPSLYTCYTILDKVLCKIVQSFLRNHSTNSHHSPSTIWIDIFPSLHHSFLLQRDDQHYWIISSTSAAIPNFHIYFIDLRSIPYDSRLYDRGPPTIFSTSYVFVFFLSRFYGWIVSDVLYSNLPDVCFSGAYHKLVLFYSLYYLTKYHVRSFRFLCWLC